MRIYILSILLLSIPYISWGACDPETVQFYLDKGFTQEQITKLCSQSSNNAPQYEPYQKPVVIYQEGGYKPGVSAEERKAIQELKGSISGRSVDITDDHISYIRNVCIVAGNSGSVDQRGKECVDVAYSIARQGLKVTESGRGFLLFGNIELDVESSDIKRKTVIADPWEGYSPDIRYALKRKYEATETGNSTTIPIRKSASTGQVVQALKTIAASTEIRESGHDSEVAKVLDESYEAPSKEEYATTQAKDAEEIAQEEEKKKKKKSVGGTRSIRAMKYWCSRLTVESV